MSGMAFWFGLGAACALFVVGLLLFYPRFYEHGFWGGITFLGSILVFILLVVYVVFRWLDANGEI